VVKKSFASLGGGRNTRLAAEALQYLKTDQQSF
jgi:hypothetical protein